MTENNSAQAAEQDPLSDQFVNAVIRQHGYDSPEAVIARLWQWIGLNGSENGVTLLMYEAHKVLSKLRAPVADERDRNDTISQIVGLCNRIPGATTWNAAQFMYDEMHRRAALASAPVAGAAQPVASLGVVLGLGEYLIQTTASGEPAQVVFSQASDHDRATRTIGDLKVGGHGPFDPSRIRGQIQFTSAVALDALEVQLRELRKEHWPDTFDAAPQASECECSRKSKAVADSEAEL